MLGNRFPLQPALVLGFVVWLFACKKSSFASIRMALVSLRDSSRFLGTSVDALCTPRLLLLLRAIRKQRPGKKRLPRVPITVWVIQLFVDSIKGEKSYETSLLLAILCVGVYGLFRAGELIKKKGNVYLLRNAVIWRQECVIIHLDESKTDVFRHGADICLHKNNSATCPYSTLKVVWDAAVDKRGVAPVFQNKNGSPVDYKQLLSSLKLLMGKLNFDVDKVGTHSMRIGGATTLAILGVPAHIIKILGRWSSLCYQVYTRTSDSCIRSVQARMGASEKASKENAFGGLNIKVAKTLSVDELAVRFGV